MKPEVKFWRKIWRDPVTGFWKWEVGLMFENIVDYGEVIGRGERGSEAKAQFSSANVMDAYTAEYEAPVEVNL